MSGKNIPLTVANAIRHWKWYGIIIFMSYVGLPPVAFFFIKVKLLECSISTTSSLIILIFYIMQSIAVTAAFLKLILKKAKEKTECTYVTKKLGCIIDLQNYLFKISIFLLFAVNTTAVFYFA